MAELIHCPSCQRSLRVPDEMIGRSVKCPECGMVFLTVANQPPPTDSEVVPVVQPIMAPAYPEEYAQEQRGPGAILFVPAIALLLVGVVGFLVGGLFLIGLINITEEDIQDAIEEQLRNMPPNPQQRDVTEKVMRAMMGPAGVTFSAVFLGTNVLVVLSACLMMFRRFYSLCVLGSILGMVFNACWCLGLPVGLWALLVLLRSDVRAAFH